jgi:hypothetical protein
MSDRGTLLLRAAPAPADYRVAFIQDYWKNTRSVQDRLTNTARYLARNGLSAIPTAGTISGVVLEAGVAVPNCLVRVFERASALLAAQVYTDGSGNFSVPNLRAGNPDYFVVAFDPDGGVMYNALISDRVSPV